MEQIPPSRPASRLLAPRLLALAFVLISLIGGGFVAVSLPPYQAPDEARHVMRTWQIAHGGVVGTRIFTNLDLPSRYGMAGGDADPVLLDLWFFTKDWNAPQSAEAPRQPPQLTASVSILRWDKKHPESLVFPDTALYSPVFYLPAAVGLRLGIGIHLPVAPTLILARLGQTLATTTLGGLAIALSGAMAPWLFLLLSLPMALSQAGGCVPDGPTLACAALAAGLLGRLLAEEPPPAFWRHGAATLALAAVAMARPPYFFLGLILLLPGGVTRLQRWASLAFVIACAVGWAVFAHERAAENYGILGSSLPDQALGVLRAPWRFALVLLHTLWEQTTGLSLQFVGVLGQLNMPLPHWFYLLSGPVLALGLAVSVRGNAGAGAPQARGGFAWRAAGLSALAILCAAGGLAGAVYLVWSPVGADQVLGLQGRYFLPIAAFLPLAFTGLGTHRTGQPPALLRAALLALPVAFSVASAAVTLQAVAGRY